MNSGELDILLVEDNQDDVDLALHALRREKLANHIFVVRDGEEALDFLFCRGAFAQRSFDHPPKLVLLDLKLPKVDGMEVLTSGQERATDKDHSRRHPDFLEGRAGSGERVTTLGANSYIQKPVDFDQFREMVRQVGLYWLVCNQAPLVANVPRPIRQKS